MRYFLTLAVFGLGLFSAACSPGLNWRDVRPTKLPLLALFPCKPDDAERRLPLGDKTVLMRMLSCEAEGATFTLAYADTKPDPDPRLGETLALWQAATLRQAKATAPTELAFSLKGALALPQSVKIIAQGRKPDGSALSVHAVWFAVGSTVVQAAIYSSSPDAAATQRMADAYFSGLQLQ
jgi:hypothetical protein